MKIVNIIRTETSNQGTFGLLSTTGFSCYTGELEWQDNQHGISCIPAGSYQCVWHNSPSKGWVYEVTNVPDRGDILIHIANFCGTTPEYKTDLLGCIGLGTSLGSISGQKAIISSGLAIHSFFNFMNEETFTLNISWDDGIGENA